MLSRVIETVDETAAPSTTTALDGTTTTTPKTIKTYERIDVTPDTKIDNSLRYRLEIVGCTDADGKLQYEYQYYSSYQDMQDDLRAPVKNRIKLLSQRDA